MTHDLNRRHLLSLAVGGSALSMAACSTITAPFTVSQVATDVATMADGFLAVLPVIGATMHLTPSVMATVSSAISDLQTLAHQIQTATDLTVTQPIIQQVEADVNTIVSALAGLPLLPPQITLALQSAVVLLPIIEAAVNLMVPAKLTARAANIPMTPEQARLNLQSLAHK